MLTLRFDCAIYPLRLNFFPDLTQPSNTSYFLSIHGELQEYECKCSSHWSVTGQPSSSPADQWSVWPANHRRGAICVGEVLLPTWLGP